MRRRVNPPLPTVRGVGPARVRMPGPGSPDPVLRALDGLPTTAADYVQQRFPDDAAWFAHEVAAAAEQSALAMREAAHTASGLICAIEGARIEVEAAAEIATAAARNVIAQGMTAEADAKLIDAAVSDLPRALRA